MTERVSHYVPDGTFENTWQPPVDPTGEHTLSGSGVWSEPGVVSGEGEYVPFERSDYAKKEPTASTEELAQTPVEDIAPKEDPVSVEEMLATAAKVQKTLKKYEAAPRAAASTKPVAKEAKKAVTDAPKDEVRREERPRQVRTVSTPSRATNSNGREAFATAREGAPAGAHVAAAILNSLFEDGFGSRRGRREVVRSDPLDVYVEREQLKAARRLIRGEVAKIDAYLRVNTNPESNQRAKEATRRKQLLDMVTQAEKGMGGDLDLYRVSVIQKNVQKMRQEAEEAGKVFNDSKITKVYMKNANRAATMDQPTADSLDETTRQKYLRQEKRAKIALLFRRPDGTFPF